MAPTDSASEVPATTDGHFVFLRVIRRWLGIAQGRLTRWAIKFVIRTRVRLSEFGAYLMRVYLDAPTEPEVHDIASGKPMPLNRIPVHSTKADAKRALWAHMRLASGNPDISWKAAQKLCNKLLREARERGELVDDAEVVNA